MVSRIPNRIKSKLKRKFNNLAEKALVEIVRPYTLCSSDRIRTLIKLSKEINSRQVNGDFVECGTYKGGTAAVLSKFMGSGRRLWIYDSFEGMPKTKDIDGEDAKEWIGKCVGSVADVKKVMRLLSISEQDYIIKKGWFNQTFREELPRKVALLHCDADWYEPVSLALDTFYPLITECGCIILDDFGYWEGCREAFYDFCMRHNEKPLLERVGVYQTYWIKGKKNNRD